MLFTLYGWPFLYDVIVLSVFTFLSYITECDDEYIWVKPELLKRDTKNI